MNILLKVDNSAMRLVFLVLTILLIVFIDFFSIEIINKKIYLWKEAEDVDEITEGLKINFDKEASNKKGIISFTQSHSVRAYAKYNIKITEPGEYQFWARCRWQGACSNNFLVRMDDGNRNKFGGEPIYMKWIWSEGIVYNLSKGDHVFYVWNEEALAEMDKFLFTTDIFSKPTGFGEFNTFFIDFEFEKPISLFVRKYSKNWKIYHLEAPITKLLFKPRDILKPDIIAQKLTGNKDFFSTDLRFFLPLDLKMKIDNGNFNSVTPIELSNLFNTMIQSQDFLGTNYDGELIKRNLIGRINYRRSIIINNFQRELALMDNSFFNHSLYMRPSENRTPDYVKVNSNSPESYIILFNYKFGELTFNKKNLSVLFNLQDDNNYYNLELKNNTFYLHKLQNGKVKELGISSIENLPKNNNFNDLTIIREFPNIIIKYNHNTILIATDSSFSSGDMAIGSKFGDLYIDDIQQITTPDINFQRDFFGHGFFIHSIYRHYINNGFWYQTGENEKYLVGRKNNRQDAIITFGYDYWKNYLIEYAFNFKKGSSAGVLFNVQDLDNYYQFRWLQKMSNRSVLQLLKVKNGITEVLDEKVENSEPPFWHKVVIKSLNGHLSVLIHDKIRLKAKDIEYLNGYVGFWTDSEEEIAIDDINIHTIVTLQEDIENEITYEFTNRSRISMGLCAWIPKGNMSYVNYFGMNEIMNKKLFENYRLLNREKFTEDIKVDFTFVHEKFDLQYIPLNLKGISPLLMFDCYAGKKNYTFVFRIEKDAAVLYRNEMEITRINKTGDNSPLNITAQYKNNTLSFTCNNKDSLHYKPEIHFDNYQIGFGFDGIGALNRIHPKIKISRN